MGTLKNLVVAVTGTFDHEHSQLKRWIEANGGRYSPSVRKGITHLITGKDAWKAASDAVQAAVAIGAFVVSYDWLEDSLHRGRKLAEKKYTWEYKWQERRTIRQMEKIGLLADTKKFNDGCEDAKRATSTGTLKSRTRVVVRKPKQSKSFFFGDVVNVAFVSAADDLKRKRDEREESKAKKAEEQAVKKANQAMTDRATSTPSATQSFTSNAEATLFSPPESLYALSTTSFQPAPPVPAAPAKKPSLKDLYHYYLDTTGFEYKTLLTRCNLRSNEITRYRLSILESHTKPHVYCTFVEYFPPRGAGTTTSSSEACIQAMFEFNATFADTDPPDLSSDAPSRAEDDAACLPLPQQLTPSSHPEAARLQSILAPPGPSASLPYKSLIAPMNSPFAFAWRAFRNAFRDLTLLAWEERFDIRKTLYKARAAALSIEPFVYVRPKAGLPLGLRVQEEGLFQNPPLPSKDKTGAIVSLDRVTDRFTGPVQGDEDGYTYNAFALPSLAHPLGDGIIGRALLNDAAAAEKRVEEARQRNVEAEKKQMRALGLARRRETQGKPNFSRPLFNGVTGRPMVDAWGRWKSGGSQGGVGSAVRGGGVVKQRFRRPFPSERGL
ncbi:hypothetical protein SVAN01_10754 [Stagonosporopsis vannaccii]|nr:hypothetical protein SVAN01_10754 [Stagonosporopsis vannaccii]